MLTLGSMGFFYGVFDRIGFFHYRTPKSGSGEATKTRYFHALTNDRNAIVEGLLAVSGIALSVLVLLRGVWFLSLSMLGFGAFTLWSMNLGRHLQSKSEPSSASEAQNPDLVVSVTRSLSEMARKQRTGPQP
jgi:hypothetical protein